MLNRKSPRSKPYLALLLDRARAQVGPEARPEALVLARTAVDYLPDAQILAEAMEARASYLVSLDRTHLVGDPHVARLLFSRGDARGFPGLVPGAGGRPSRKVMPFAQQTSARRKPVPSSGLMGAPPLRLAMHGETRFRFSR